MEAGRRIQFEKLINTRDLGGFSAADGRTVRPGLLLRSGELGGASKSDLKKLADEYRLRTVIDFRTSLEQEKKPDPEIPGAVHITNPILNEETMGITHEKEGDAKDADPKKDWVDVLIDMASAIAGAPGSYMERMYRKLALEPHARLQYGKFLTRLAAGDGDGAVLWHCTAGKDRVGVGTALLLTALGVDRQSVIGDYMKTNDYYREQNGTMAEEIFCRTGDRAVADSAVSLYSVKESYIRSVFEGIEAEYGTVERYFSDGLSVGKPEQARLRELYLI